MILALDVEPSSRRGGQERSLHDLLIGLRELEGLEIKLGYLQSGDYLEDYMQAGIQCFKVPRFSIKSKFSPREWFKVAESLRLFAGAKPSIIYCNQLMDLPLAGLAKVLGLVQKIVCHLRLPPPNAKHLNQLRLGAKTVDRFVVANSNMKDAWGSWGIPEQKLIVLPNAFRMDDFPDSAYSGPAENLIKVGYLGRIDKNKGVHVALEAIASLKQECFPCRFLIGGKAFPDGEIAYLKELERLVHKLGLEKDVDFLGHVTDLENFFESVDVMLFPSLWNEPFGRVLVESVMHNRPVIAHDVGSVREILGEAASPWIYTNLEDLKFVLRNFTHSWRDYPLETMQMSMRKKFGLRESVAHLSSILNSVLSE